MDANDIVDRIRQQNHKNGGALVMDNDEAVRLVQSAIDAETERCAAIVQLAREGEIDQDFRSIIHRIESHSPAAKDD